MLPIPIRLLKNPWCCGDWRDSLSGGSTPGERIMRGTDERSGSLFSYVDLEARVVVRRVDCAPIGTISY